MGARGARLAFVTTFRNISGNPHGYWIVSNWRGLERETGIEPATSRLGSPRERCGQREINGLAWVVEGTKRHFYNHVFDHQSSVSRTIGGDGNRIVAKDGLCKIFFCSLALGRRLRSKAFQFRFAGRVASTVFPECICCYRRFALSTSIFGEDEATSGRHNPSEARVFSGYRDAEGFSA